VAQGRLKRRVANAGQADSTPLRDGLTLPEEIARRQERQAALEKARAEMEVRAHARYAAGLAGHEKKLARRAAKKPAAHRRSPRHPSRKPKTNTPSRIPRAGS
jgi:hypothetical protein